MQKKSRVKIENGEVKFIDPIDMGLSGNGIIIFFTDIENTLTNKPLKGSLPTNKNDDLIEADIRTLRVEVDKNLEEKSQNWNI